MDKTIERRLSECLLEMSIADVHEAIDMLRLHEQTLRRALTLSFKRGDPVAWTKNGTRYTGTIVKINAFTFEIVERKTRTAWKVDVSQIERMSKAEYMLTPK